MKLFNIIEQVIRDFLSEQGIEKLSNPQFVNSLLKGLNIVNFEVLGSGQHGTSVLNKDTDKVVKFTESTNEILIANKLLNNKFNSLPIIYEVNKINNINYYVRDLLYPISDEEGEKIDEELEEILDFFYEKNMSSRKSNTNLTYYFDDKFLDYLDNLKYAFKTLGVGQEFDINGIALNTYKDSNDNYVLGDF